MQKNCCFIGYRNIPIDALDDVRRELEQEIDKALEDGYRVFITPFAEGCDRLFMRLVNERRLQYPDIFLEGIIPTPDHAREYLRSDWELLAKCDGIKVLCEKCQQDYALNITRYQMEQCARAIGIYSTEADNASLYAIDYARTTERDLRLIII